MVRDEEKEASTEMKSSTIDESSSSSSGSGSSSSSSSSSESEDEPKLVVRKPQSALLEAEVLELGLRERWNLAASLVKADSQREAQREASQRRVAQPKRRASVELVDAGSLEWWRAQSDPERARAAADVVSVSSDLEEPVARPCGFAPHSRVWIACDAIINWPWFDRAIIILIVVNSMGLAAQDPRGNESLFTVVSELIFNIIFTFEMVVKMIGLGVWYRGETAYFRDNWNCFDFTTVCLSWLPYVLCFVVAKDPINCLFGGDSGGINVTYVRLVRVVKILKTVQRMPGMRCLVVSLFKSAPLLLQVSQVLLFIFFVFGAIGVQLFMGVLRQTCFDEETEEPVFLREGVCSEETQWGGKRCGAGRVCRDVDFEGKPNDGPGHLNRYVSFDNIALGFATVLTTISLEGWTTTMYILMDALGPIVVVYFVLLILIGSFFVVNLVVAVIYQAYVAEEATEEPPHTSEIPTRYEGDHHLRAPSSELLLATAHSDATLRLHQLTSLSHQQPETTTNKVMHQHCWRHPTDSGAPSMRKRSSMSMWLHPQEEEEEEEDGGERPWSMSDCSEDDISTASSPKRTSKSSPKIEPLSPSPSAVSMMAGLHLGGHESGPSLFPDRRMELLRMTAPGWRREVTRRWWLLRDMFCIVANSAVFNYAVMGCVLLNTILLMAEHESQGQAQSYFSCNANTFLTYVFLGEMIVKMLGTAYIFEKDDGGLNLFDGVITVGSLAELIIGSKCIPGDSSDDDDEEESNDASALSVLQIGRILRLFRLFRSFRMVRKWKSMSHIITALVRSGPALVNFLCLLIMFSWVYALAGMQLYALRFEDQVGRFKTRPRSNFDSLDGALLTVFVVVSGENWDEILDFAYRASGLGGLLFVISMYLIGNFLVLNIFLAILLSNFEVADVVTDANLYNQLEDSNEFSVFMRRVQKFFSQCCITVQLRAASSPRLVRAVHGAKMATQPVRSEVNKSVRSVVSSPRHANRAFRKSVANLRKAAGLPPLYSRPSLAGIYEVDEDGSDDERPKKHSRRKEYEGDCVDDEEQEVDVHKFLERKATSPVTPIKKKKKKKKKESPAPLKPPGLRSSKGLLSTKVSTKGRGSFFSSTAAETAEAEAQKMHEFIEQMQQEMQTSTCHRGRREFHDCFAASVAVDWMIDTAVATDPEEAVALGQKLLDLRLITAVEKSLTSRVASMMKSKRNVEPEPTPKKRAIERFLLPRTRRAKLKVVEEQNEPTAEFKALQKESERFADDHVLYRFCVLQVHRMEIVGDPLSMAKKRARATVRDKARRRRTLLTSAGCADSRIRQGAVSLVMNPWFEFCIGVLIIVSSVMLAADNPDPRKRYKSLVVADIVLTLAFNAEFAIRITALGPWEYFIDRWNLLDCMVVAVSDAGLLLKYTASSSGQDLGYLKALRALRALRPLRMIQRYPAMKTVVDALLEAVPDVMNVGLVVAGIFCVFAVAGGTLFRGLLDWCHVSAKSRQDCSSWDIKCDYTGLTRDDFEFAEYWARYNVDKDECRQYAKTRRTVDGGMPWDRISSSRYLSANATAKSPLEAEWRPAQPNFNNIGEALLALFEIATLEGWPPMMYAVMDIVVDPNDHPRQNAARPHAIFYVIFVVIGSFFVMNIFVGVVVHKFQVAKERTDGSSIFLTEMQRGFVDRIKVLLDTESPTRLRPPRSRWRRKLFFLTTSERFEYGIILAIVLNMVAISLNHYDQSPVWDFVLESVLNPIFTLIFIFEMAVKMLGLGPKQYFESAWNCFDAFIVTVSVLDTASVFAIFDTIFNVSFNLSLFRILRLVRIVKLVNVNAGLKTLLRSLVISLPSLMNVGSLLLLLIFVYACIGMNLYYDVRQDGLYITQYCNFETFGYSMLTLFRCLTGEDWNKVMQAIVDDDNNISAYFYFASFMVLGNFMLLNLCVAVILEAFAEFMDADSEQERGRRELRETIEHFKEVWLRHDHDNAMFIPSYRIVSLLQDLPIHMGFRTSDYAAGGDTSLPAFKRSHSHHFFNNMGGSFRSSKSLMQSAEPSNEELKADVASKTNDAPEILDDSSAEKKFSLTFEDRALIDHVRNLRVKVSATGDLFYLDCLMAVVFPPNDVNLSTISDDSTMELNSMLLRSMDPILRRKMEMHAFRHDLPDLDITIVMNSAVALQRIFRARGKRIQEANYVADRHPTSPMSTIMSEAASPRSPPTSRSTDHPPAPPPPSPPRSSHTPAPSEGYRSPSRGLIDELA